MPTFTAEHLGSFVEVVLTRAGLTADEARHCADAAVFANLRGTETHGIVYMIPRMLKSLQSGQTVPGAQHEVTRESSGSALLRSNGQAGPMLGYLAMQLAVQKARQNGVGVVVTINGGPLGMLGYFADLAARQGLFGLVMANTSPSVAPHGSSTAVFGTNPFAYAAPGATGPTILLDIATSVAASGKLASARRRGESLPDGWIVDAAGAWITDPNRSGDGAMLAFGGHKGSGIALLVHVLTGMLGGTTVGGESTHGNPDPNVRGQSCFYLAIDPEHFASRETFERLADRQIAYVHAAQPLPGFEEVLVPGARGARTAEVRQREGIPVPEADWSAVLAAISSAGLPADEIASQYTALVEAHSATGS
ncbi:MAG: Ldh family oxidoreductase [Chloroflexi bacterium]|nr:Ldh family oxidoreductase [Chloroflexota bacterium]